MNVYEPTKRLFDVAAASAGLAILSPFLLGISAAVLATEGSPILYRARRTGKDGRIFTMYKFRTMVKNAEKVGGLSTGKDDPRITRIGRVLRKYKIDELPQLINVLTGEMSLVGPRPEVPQYTDMYQGEELIILSVKPGITDYSSIRFVKLNDMLGNHEVDRTFETEVMPEKTRLRVKYVKERGLLVDAGILLKTIKTVVMGS